jgi:hypothetical protein
MSRRHHLTAVAAVTGALAIAAPAAQADTAAVPAAQGPIATAWQEGAAAAVQGWKEGAAAGLAGWQAGAVAMRDAYQQVWAGIGD